MSEFNMEDPGEGSSSSAYPEFTATEFNMEDPGEGSSSSVYPEFTATESNMEDIGEGPSSSAYPEVAATGFVVEDPNEDAHSNASTEIVGSESNADITVNQHYTMPNSADADGDSDPEDYLPWEDVDLMNEILGETDLDKHEPVEFGSNGVFTFDLSRTDKPFPVDWTDAQKVAAISPNSPHYKAPQPPREFPPDWTPAQIAAANSPTSPFHVAPGVPITSTTWRLPERPLPGLFSQISVPPQASGGIFGLQPNQTSVSPEAEAMKGAGLFAGLFLPSSSDPSNSGQSTFQSLTQSIPQFIDSTLLTQGSSQSVNPGLPTPTSQGISPQPMVPSPYSADVLSPSATMHVFENIMEERKPEKYEELYNKPRIWVNKDDRPTALKPKSRLARFGNAHRQQIAEDIAPVGGPTPSNRPCTLCFQSRDALLAEVEPRVRMEESVKIRKELELGLRNQVEGEYEKVYAELIDKLRSEIEERKQKCDRLWCQKDQLESDLARLQQEKEEEDTKATVKAMEARLEVSAEVNEIVTQFKNANSIDEKTENLAKLMFVRKEGEIPCFTQREVDGRVQEFINTQMPIVEARWKSEHQEQVDRLTRDFQAEIIKAQTAGQTESAAQGPPLDQIQSQAQLEEKQRDFDRQLAENRQACDNILAAKQQDFDRQLAENRQTYDNAVAAQQREFERQLAEHQDQFNVESGRMQQELSNYISMDSSEECEQKLKEQEDNHKRQLREKHDEYSAMHNETLGQYNTTINEKQREIDILRAEKQQRELQPVFNTEPVMSFEEIDAHLSKETMDMENSLNEQLLAKLSEDYKQQIRDQCIQEVHKQIKEDQDLKAAKDLELVNKWFEDQPFQEDQPMENFGEGPSADIPSTSEATSVNSEALIHQKLQQQTAQLQQIHNAEKTQMQQQFEAEKTQLQQKHSAELAQEVRSVRMEYEAKLIESQNSPKPNVADAQTSTDPDPTMESILEGFSNLAIVDPSQSIVSEPAKPVNTQGLSKSDDAGSSPPIDTDSSKSIATEPSKSTVADSSEPTDSSSTQSVVTDPSKSVDTHNSSKPIDIDSPKPVAIGDSSTAVEIQSSSTPILTKDSSVPAESQIENSSVPADAQVISELAGVINSPPTIDSPHSYKAKLDAEHERKTAYLYQKWEEAEERLGEKYEREFNERIAAAQQQWESTVEGLRTQFRDECTIHLQKQHEQQGAAFDKRFDDGIKEMRIKLTATTRAELTPIIRAELAPTIRAELTPTIRAELTSIIRAELTPTIRAEVKESSERKSPKNPGKTVGQDARNSDRADGQGVRTTSKKDEPDAELIKIKKQLTELQDKYKVLQVDFEAEQSSYAKLCEEYDAIVKQEQATTKTLDSSRYQVVRLEAALKDTNEISLRQKAQLSDNDRLIIRLNKDVGELQSDLALASKEARVAYEDLAKLRRASHKAEANARTLKEINEELFRTNEDLASELSKKQPAPVEGMLEDVRREKVGLEAEVKKYADQADKLARQNGSQRDEMHQALRKHATAQDNLDAANLSAMALTRDLNEARRSNSGLVADITRVWAAKVALEKAAREAARKTSQEDHLRVPRWLTWLLIGIFVACSFVFCGIDLFVDLSAERDVRQWLGGNDLPRAALESSATWGIGKGGIW